MAKIFISYRHVEPDHTIARSLLRKFASDGNAREAREHYAEAVAQATEFQDALTDHQVCVSGSVQGFASIVMQLCERTLTLEPESAPLRRNGRGMARARLGDLAGAAEDLGAYAAGLEKMKNPNHELWVRVHDWTDALSHGRNPFDAQTLEQLRREDARATQEP